MKPRFYYCDLYKMNFYFCIGWRPAEFEKYAKRTFDHELSLRAHRGKTLAVSNDRGMVIVIWTEKKRDFACLAHECVHAANFTLEARGCQPSFENDEPQAYLVDVIFSKAIGG